MTTIHDADTIQADHFKGNIGTVSWLLAMPTLTMMAGGLFSFLHTLGPKQIAGLQHFASGIILAAVGWELAPEIKTMTHLDKGALIFGFLLGATVLMFVGRYDFKHWKRCYGGHLEEEATLIGEESSGKIELEPSKAEESITRREVPTGLIFAVLLDGAIDGLLIGITYVASSAGGLITSIALSLEMGLLGISTCSTLRKTSLSTAKVLGLCLTLPLAIIAAGLLGSTVFSGLTGTLYILVVAFGAAGLLYLVTEELMIEAHEDEETDRWYVSAMFFLGFLFVIILDEYMPSDI